jgi:hypothetical protein
LYVEIDALKNMFDIFFVSLIKVQEVCRRGVLIAQWCARGQETSKGFYKLTHNGCAERAGGSINYVNRQGSKNTVVAICTFGKKIVGSRILQKIITELGGVGEFSFLSSNGIDFFQKNDFFQKKRKKCKNLSIRSTTASAPAPPALHLTATPGATAIGSPASITHGLLTPTATTIHVAATVAAGPGVVIPVNRKYCYRLFFLRSIAHFFTQIYTNCFVSS